MKDLTWLDRAEYPFESNHLDVDGGRMHYVDEGAGPVVLLVHGTPTWSFLYRRLIRELARDHRVIAPDNIGFGMSDKPAVWSYRPADHAANLATLIRHLGLGSFTLVVHDFGGPIGLAYAVDHPEQIERIVLFNTFLWSLEGSPTAVKASKFFSGPIGRFLYERMNFSPRWLVPMSFADRSKLTPAIHRHYTAPFSSKNERRGAWTFAKELIGSSRWFESLWERRSRLSGIPSLILWGMKDPAFDPEALERWRGALPDAEVRTFEAGHFVQEEVPDYPSIVHGFLKTTKASA